MQMIKDLVHSLKSNYYMLRENMADNRGNIHDSINYRLAYVRAEIRHQTAQHAIRR